MNKSLIFGPSQRCLIEESLALKWWNSWRPAWYQEVLPKILVVFWYKKKLTGTKILHCNPLFVLVAQQEGTQFYRQWCAFMPLYLNCTLASQRWKREEQKKGGTQHRFSPYVFTRLQWHESKWNWRLNWSLSNTNPLDYCWPVIFHFPVNLVVFSQKNDHKLFRHLPSDISHL